MRKDITNKNTKNEYHGYQEWYGHYELCLRGTYKNDELIGYEEWHIGPRTNFYIK